ncbi:MAG: Hpt domain-containing protein, partial [Angelakisella sp.]
MSVFDASMVPMIEMFIFETTTLLEQLDEILLDSEKNKNMSQDNINEIFRIMHTIKGSAAMMGIESVSEVAHRIEDMFFIIRENPHIMTENTSVIFDLLFKASDFLKSEVDAINQSADDYAPADSSALIAQIGREVAVMKGDAEPKQVTAAPPTPPAADSSSAPAAPPVSAESIGLDDANTLHHIRVFFEDDCQMENIRAFML